MTKVRICEVGPRDGLQNETALIPTADKIALIDALSRVGFETIEATSFVAPKWVPQLADATAVMSGIQRAPGVSYIALTPNMQGFERALAAGVDAVAIFTAASETFCQKNTNCSIAESLARFVPIMVAAEAANIPVRGYVSCVVACPYEGEIAPPSVRHVATQLIDMGCGEISLGDTIGKGTPKTIGAMFKEVLRSVPSSQLAGHFHDTNGLALENIRVSLDLGLRAFDSAIGGLGGCPYAPGAKGNVSTTALVEMLHAENWHTGLNMPQLYACEALVKKILSTLNTPVTEGKS